MADGVIKLVLRPLSSKRERGHVKAQTSREGTRLVGSRAQAEGLALGYSGSGAAWMHNHGLVGLVREETRGQLS